MRVVTFSPLRLPAGLPGKFAAFGTRLRVQGGFFPCVPGRKSEMHVIRLLIVSGLINYLSRERVYVTFPGYFRDG
jgi:hypothetical protein